MRPGFDSAAPATPSKSLIAASALFLAQLPDASAAPLALARNLRRENSFAIALPSVQKEGLRFHTAPCFNYQISFRANCNCRLLAAVLLMVLNSPKVAGVPVEGA